jgi:hypothetical protein
MVLLMRYAGLRISDVVTLSRDHINANRLWRQATKNHNWIRVELPAVVVEALEQLPQPEGRGAGRQVIFFQWPFQFAQPCKGLRAHHGRRVRAFWC